MYVASFFMYIFFLRLVNVCWLSSTTVKDVLIFCYVMNYCKFSILKQWTFLLSLYLWVKSMSAAWFWDLQSYMSMLIGLRELGVLFQIHVIVDK